MAPTIPTLREIPIQLLGRHCRTEAQRFRNRQENDTCFCHELLRRALVENCQPAWEIVHDLYQTLVLAWIRQSLSLSVEQNELQMLVNDSLVKWHGTFRRHPEKFVDYPTLTSLLGVLRHSVQFVVCDYVQTQRREPLTQPLEESEVVLTSQVAIGRDPANDLWSLLHQLLNGEQEEVVVRFLLIEGDKPRDLYEEFPHIFQSVDEINTIRERVIARLRRNRQFRAFLNDLSENKG